MVHVHNIREKVHMQGPSYEAPKMDLVYIPFFVSCLFVHCICAFCCISCLHLVCMMLCTLCVYLVCVPHVVY